MIRRAIRSLITLYKILISPLLPQACRFHPTCSEYAYDAFSTRSLLIAFYLTTRRLLRCHPFNAGGYDPVPPALGYKTKEKISSSRPDIEVF